MGAALGDLPNWRAVMQPGGRWSALVTAGSSAARAARSCAGLAYLAVPYAGEVALRGDWRLERSVRFSTLAAREAVRLMAEGCVTVCPVIQQAEMAHAGGLVPRGLDPLKAEIWRDMGRRLRNVAALVVVPDLQGWDRCPAIWEDVTWALERNIAVHLYAERAGS